MLNRMLEWYDLTDEERRVRDLALEVARAEVAPRAEKHDLEGTFARDSLNALAEAGLFGVNVPKEYGGLGAGPMGAVLVVEAVASACGSTAASYMFHCNLIHVLTGAGPESLRQKYLPQLAQGKLGAWAINERVRLFRDPFETTIEEKNGRYVLNGEKPFSTSAGEADVTIVQAQKPGVPIPFPALSQEYVLIDRDTPGYSAEVYDPLGLRGASNGKIKLDNVEVPLENQVGEEPARMFRAVAFKGRSALGPNVLSAGIAGAALDAATRHTRKRGAEQWQTHMLASMSDKLNALRCYNYLTARLMRSGSERAMVAAHIEIQRLGGAIGYWVCDRAMEVMGGASFMRGSPVQRYYRDARGSAYLAFAMDDRRELVTEVLLGADTVEETGERPTMRWDPLAEYGFRMSAASTLNMPEDVRNIFGEDVFSFNSIEDYTKSVGADEVTLEHIIGHRMHLVQQFMSRQSSS